jgi:hypothetical protein
MEDVNFGAKTFSSLGTGRGLRRFGGDFKAQTLRLENDIRNTLFQLSKSSSQTLKVTIYNFNLSFG